LVIVCGYRADSNTVLLNDRLYGVIKQLNNSHMSCWLAILTFRK
jgi:hypothetical protein